MADMQRKGIDYFPLSVNFLDDIKVRKIVKACGYTSVLVLIRLLCNIYQYDGYYTEWDEDICFIVADDIGTNEVSVQEIVKKAIQVDFFNKEKYEKYGILTSKGIQSRYLEATKRRKENSIKKEYCVHDENTMYTECTQDVCTMYTECRQSVYKNGQSKVKKSKVKESKVNNSADAVDNNIYNNAPVHTSSLKQIIAFFQNNTNQSATPVIIFEFEKLLEQGATVEIIEEAIKESVVNDKRSMRYIIAIVNNWLAKKVTCVDDIRRLKADFENKKQHQSTARYALQTNKKIKLTQEELDAMQETSTPADDEWQELLRNRKSK